jgi:hypothetical protein
MVTAGGMTIARDLCDRQWIDFDRRYLAPADVLGTIFKGKLCDAIEQAQRTEPFYIERGSRRADFDHTLRRLRRMKRFIAWSGVRRDDPRPLLGYFATALYGGPVSDRQLVRVDDENVTYIDRSRRRRAKAPCDGTEASPAIEHVELTVPLRTYGADILRHALPAELKASRPAGLYANGSRKLLDLAHIRLHARHLPKPTERKAPPVDRHDDDDDRGESLLDPHPTHCEKCQHPLFSLLLQPDRTHAPRFIHRPRAPPASNHAAHP